MNEVAIRKDQKITFSLFGLGKEITGTVDHFSEFSDRYEIWVRFDDDQPTARRSAVLMVKKER